MQTLLQDLRLGLRMLAKNPGFTAIAVITLALGIGANTAIFSMVRGVLLRPLPFANSDRLLLLQETTGGSQPNPVSYPTYLDWRSQTHSFVQMAAYADAEFILAGPEKSERLYGEEVTDNYFDLLGEQSAKGRNFIPEENKTPLTHPVAIISHGLWQRVYGSDPLVIGKTIRLNNFDFTIVGVTARGFTGFSDSADVWIPFMMRDAAWPEVAKFDFLHSRDVHYAKVIGLVKPHVLRATAVADLSTVVANLLKAFPKENQGRRLLVRPASKFFTGQSRTPLLVLLGAVGLVLLIACANVVNLLSSRAVARHREFAVRLSLGAGRSRLLRQLTTETLLVTVLGAAFGVASASWGLAALVRILPLQLPSFASIEIDRTVLLFSCALVFVMSVLIGILSSSGISSTSAADALREDAKSSSSKSARRLGRLLIASEVALSLVLLIGAGLLLQSLANLLHADPGFRPDHLLTMRFYVPKRPFPGDGTQRFGPNLADAVTQVPGVQSAAVTFIDPFLWSGFSRGFTIEGRDPLPASEMDELFYQEIGPNFFKTMGIPLRAGRDFTMRDDLHAPGCVLVNEAFARRYWPNQNPVGKRLKYGPVDSHYSWMEVIGVAGDSKFASLRQNADITPVIYGALLQSEVIINMSLVARTQGDPTAMLGTLREAIHRFDPETPVYNIATIDERMRANTSATRSYAILLGLFAALALILAMVGIYGVVSYWVGLRSREMGIRVALGAQSKDVLGLVFTEGLRLMAGGVIAGIVGALVLTRYLQSMLYGVRSADPATYVTLSALLLVVGALASYVPARRATRVDPMIALRYE